MILDEAQRIKNWKTRTAQTRQATRLEARHRVDRHAAGEPDRGTALDRRVRRSLSAGADVPIPARAPARRRGRPRGRLPQPVEDFGDAALDPHSPHEGQGAARAARADGKTLLRADDERADGLPRGEPGDRRPDRAEVAPVRFPDRGRSTADARSPCKTCGCRATARTCWTRRPTTA